MTGVTPINANGPVRLMSAPVPSGSGKRALAAPAHTVAVSRMKQSKRQKTNASSSSNRDRMKVQIKSTHGQVDPRLGGPENFALDNDQTSKSIQYPTQLPEKMMESFGYQYLASSQQMPKKPEEEIWQDAMNDDAGLELNSITDLDFLAETTQLAKANEQEAAPKLNDDGGFSDSDFFDPDAIEILQSLAGQDSNGNDPVSNTTPSEETALTFNCQKSAHSSSQFNTDLGPSSTAFEIVLFDSSGDVNDPSLKRSPLDSDDRKHPQPDEDLLDDEVDWNQVMGLIPTPPKSSSPPPPGPAFFHGLEKHPLGHTQNPSQPFTRIPYPNPIRDRSPVPGLSKTPIVRTCFRLCHLLAEGSRLFNAAPHQDAVIFELYARVTHSKRELINMKTNTNANKINKQHSLSPRQKSATEKDTTMPTTVQHFYFMDLFHDKRPHLTGTLTNWRVGGLVDARSAVFLAAEFDSGAGLGFEAFGASEADRQGEKHLCRCMCRLKRDTSNGTDSFNIKQISVGWTIEVLEIVQIGWDEVDSAKDIFGQET